MKNSFFVNEDFINIRLDRWLRKNICEVPQSLIEKNIRKGNIRINKEKKKSSYKLQINDRIIIKEHPELRVLACGYKELSEDPRLHINLEDYSYEKLEYELEYLGIIGLRDSLQENIAETVNFLENKNIPIEK